MKPATFLSFFLVCLSVFFFFGNAGLSAQNYTAGQEAAAAHPAIAQQAPQGLGHEADAASPDLTRRAKFRAKRDRFAAKFVGKILKMGARKRNPLPESDPKLMIIAAVLTALATAFFVMFYILLFVTIALAGVGEPFTLPLIATCALFLLMIGCFVAAVIVFIKGM